LGYKQCKNTKQKAWEIQALPSLYVWDIYEDSPLDNTSPIKLLKEQENSPDKRSNTTLHTAYAM